ncbi:MULTISPECIES: hypothetical protein [unclassified Sinorhizobium]|uniref:hypothetical protein n=1 Tax=unclassified Sinorhizobium TaxID=2613772 RepID=UPI003524EE85
MSAIHDAIDGVVKELIDQVPTMDVESIVLSPSAPVVGDEVIARITVAHNRSVLCIIRTDNGLDSPSLHSARVIEM